MTGLRWCTSGTCGRYLPLSEFYRFARGRWACSACKACHRVQTRERYRRLAKTRAFRVAEAARKRAAYWRDPGQRARQIARAVANKRARRAAA